MLISVVIGAIGSILLKKGSNNIKLVLSVKNIIDFLKNYNMLLGMFMHIIATTFLILALRLEKLSIVYPLTSLSYVCVSILSIYILNENMNKFKWMGIGFIILGAILITL
jgi:uncharacterized membrane protein